ncbi:MAG: alpha-N-acetylglucosaminidase [Flavisolibacter sp.]
MKRQGLKALWSTLLLGIHLVAFCGNPHPVSENSRAVYELINRVLPGHGGQFIIEFSNKINGKDHFEIDNAGSKILLKGSNGVAIASALNYYLKNIVHCSITWNGNNLRLPEILPRVPKKIEKETPYSYRYYLNYCTFNYSMSWWNWDRWQKEIDWMALNGINMPLALTGQNAIWNRVYQQMGLTAEDLKGFFSGPAYFNWFWMGNLDGWGGPLPESWMKSHEVLQKQILQRERSLGMTPVLPAFTGHVPAAFKNKYPRAKLRKTSWNGKFPEVYLLDPSDPMFIQIGKSFIKEETKTFGTDHLYTADTFNENTPPTNDSAFLSDVSRKVYQSMAAGDSKATWIMQGWLFHFSAKFWKTPQIQALLKAVPNDKMIILDLWSEKNPVWNRTEAYYGKPWIWCMLHNFGGNTSLYGRMNQVATGPAAALHDPHAGNMKGIGLTPEGIEQNPVMYDLMLENVWRDQPIELNEWLKEYVFRRYGQPNAEMDRAWKILSLTAYNDSITNGGAESIICGRPTFSKNTRGVSTRLSYQPEELLPAWQYFMEALPDLKNSEGFQYDLVDLTRQILANYANLLQQQCASRYHQGDLSGFQMQSNAFLALISDMDRLLATRKDFLLGRWLNAAKAWGITMAEKELYEKNARDLISLWGDKNSTLREYSCRQWSGLLNGFYRKRWEQFFSYVNRQMQEHQAVDENHFDELVKEWEWGWVNSHEYYQDQPQGDPVLTAQQIYRQYGEVIKQAYAKEDKGL